MPNVHFLRNVGGGHIHDNFLPLSNMWWTNPAFQQMVDLVGNKVFGQENVDEARTSHFHLYSEEMGAIRGCNFWEEYDTWDMFPWKAASSAFSKGEGKPLRPYT